MRQLAVLLLLASVACNVEQSGLVVRVDSDLAIPSELAEIHAQVLADSGEVAQEVTFSTAQTALPLSFGVRHKAGSPTQAVTVVVEGRGPGGALLVTRRATTRFVERKLVLLEVVLSRRCTSVSCPSGQTCSMGACVSDEVPATSLIEVTPGSELVFDSGEPAPAITDAAAASTPDAGAGGPADASDDPTDTGSSDGAESNPDASEPRADAAPATQTDATPGTQSDASPPARTDAAATNDASTNVLDAAPLTPADAGAASPDAAAPGGVRLINASNLTTTERGSTAQFSVVLTSAPSAEVRVAVASSNPAEGTVSPDRLMFGPLTWSVPQVVTVTGADDDVADGQATYAVRVGPTSSPDPAFDGIAAQEVPVVNGDDEMPGITVAPRTGLVTRENGGTATFSLVLNTRPTSTVTIALDTSALSEATASPAIVRFVPAAWNRPVTVTVTGVDDAVDDGDRAYSVITRPATSLDPRYDGLDADDVSATNADDDSPGIVVMPTSGLVTTESGGSGTFTVRLASQPTARVSINLISSDFEEGTVAPAQLTFTATTWSAPRTVTVTGADDDVDDDDLPFVVITAPAVSADQGYRGLDAPDVSVTNTDDDTAGVSISPRSGLVTTETGGTATFEVRLTSRPVANVTIRLASSDATEGTVSPTMLTFTPTDWRAPQQVLVTGVDDAAADGAVAYSITTALISSTDPRYAGMNPPDVSAVNNDDDTPGVTVAPTSVSTTESGGRATFGIRLNTQPAASVTIPLSSQNAREVTVSPASVTFTSQTWSTPQTVTVTGVDDALDDGDVTVSVVTGAATSADATYAGINPTDVSVTNADNDSASFVISPTAGLVTSEAGGTATFTVRLGAQPAANVVVTCASSNASEGTVSPASLTFTAASWNTPQTVTVTGVNDSVDDGDVGFTIVTGVTSADPAFATLDPADVSVTNTDNDGAGFVIAPAAGLTVTEAGGTATFTVRLASQPLANVTVGISSSDATEANVSVSSLVFTPANWSTNQTVTVTGVDDTLDDGNVAFTIRTAPAVSTDTSYDGVDPLDPMVTTTDDDTSGFAIAPLSGLMTTEAGAAAVFTVRLTAQPTANVTIGLASSDSSEGSVSPAALTFTAADWSTPQGVRVIGIDDSADDGDVAFTVITGAASSADPRYLGIDPPDVTATNADDDSAGVTVSPTMVTTTEAGGTATFTVRLNTQPSSNVSIPLSTSDATEGSVSPATLTFTPQTWSTPQTVTVTGADDVLDDGDIAYAVVTGPASSADPAFNGLNPADVNVSNTDDDSAAFQIMPMVGLVTTEAGGTATFGVKLMTQPSANVTVGLTTSNAQEGTVLPASLTFTPSSWSTPQAVTVTGVNDNVDDGDIAYTIVTSAATSADPAYNGMNPADVSVSNIDNDGAGLVITPQAGLTVTEAGGTASFTVRLASQPVANVTIGISSSDTTEATVNVSSLTFTSASWNTNQTVTITGVDDALDDGDVSLVIRTAAAVSADPAYSGVDGVDPQVTCADDDVSGFLITPSAGLVTTEAGGSTTFTVRLTAQPTAPVMLGLASSTPGEGSVGPSSLTFSETSWSNAQTVTVTGVNDNVDDGDVAYAIVTGAAASADPRYSGLNPPDVSVTNRDDDTAAINVTPTAALVTTEAGGTASFNVRLATQPIANVTVSISSSNTGEATVNATSLVFTSANWSANQTVTVAGVDEAIDDGNASFTIVTGAAISVDAAYAGLDPADVTGTNADDDTAGMVVSVTSGLVTTEIGGSASFTVRLTSQPRANVTVGLSTLQTNEIVLNPASLVFTAADWSTPHTVTVTGREDSVLDGDKGFVIDTAAATSGDAGYAGMNPPNVSGTNVDNGRLPPTAIIPLPPEGGTAASGFSELVSISADGMVMAYGSMNANIVPGDTNMFEDIFVFDRASMTTTRVSVGPTGAEANGPSFQPVLSDNGRYVVFVSNANNLVPNGGTDMEGRVYVHDRVTGQTTLASVGNGGMRAQNAYQPAISGDGRYVAFASRDPNLDPTRPNGGLFMRDRVANTTSFVADGPDSHAIQISNGGQTLSFAPDWQGRISFLNRANGTAPYDINPPGSSASWRTSMTPDGRFIGATYQASLVPADTNTQADVYLYDTLTQGFLLVSVTSGTNWAPSDGMSYPPSLTPDARFVAFVTQAPNLGAVNGMNALVVRDMMTNTNAVITTGPMQLEVDISADGRFVTWIGGDPMRVWVASR